MTQSLIFARAQPKSIKLTEKYTYYIEVDPINDLVDLGDENPQGHLEISIPYDMEILVTSQTFQDIKRQAPLFIKQGNVDIRIGYLGFSDYESSDITNDLDLNSSDILPLDISINIEELEDVHRSGQLFPCQFIHEYTPEWPDAIPVQLRVDVLDEADISNKREHWLDRLEQWKHNQETASNIEKWLAEYTHFNRVLIFYFKFALSIPYRLNSQKIQALPEDDSTISNDKKLSKDANESSNGKERELDENIPRIARLALQWPIEISHRAAILHVEGKTKYRIYDPEKGAVEWHDIGFISPLSISPGTELYDYVTPTVRLDVIQPGELYHKEHVEGEIEVKIPCALSGVEINYFNTFGKKQPEVLEYQTTLLIKFKLFLKSSFDQKRYIPNQQLEFEGVVLNELRVIDINNVLMDIGFKSKAIKIVKNEFYFITGEKGDSPEQIKLWIIVKGKLTQTTRERTIPGEHTFKTILETGHMTLNMYGRIKGNPKSLLESMNLIHNRLKEQFYHISTID
ncbi:MAG: hypothetical protein R3C14_26075 [Caldilineaceae bacterium]